MKQERLPTKKNLLKWYNINKKLPMDRLNKFWLNWEKTRLIYKRLMLAILSLFLVSCTHQVYVTQSVIATPKGLIRLGEPKKVVPNDTTIYTILYQADAVGKYTKSW